MVAYAPPTLVDPPLTRPPGFGLYSAAQVIDLTAEDRVGLGIEYVPEACGPSGFAWQSTCAGDSNRASKALGAEPSKVGGGAFWVVTGTKCFGGDNPEELARRRLVLKEQRIVENGLWTGAGGVDTSYLADPATPKLAGGAAVSLSVGLGLLEQYLGENYDGTGVIHASKVAAPAMGKQVLATRSGSALTTLLGTPIAFGQGYPGTGPGAVVPSVGQTWIYATGAVLVRRGPSFVANFEDALSRVNNDLNLIAERPVSVNFDCVVAAVLVNFDDTLDGGAP